MLKNIAIDLYTGKGYWVGQGDGGQKSRLEDERRRFTRITC